MQQQQPTSGTTSKQKTIYQQYTKTRKLRDPSHVELDPAPYWTNSHVKTHPLTYAYVYMYGAAIYINRKNYLKIRAYARLQYAIDLLETIFRMVQAIGAHSI